MAQPTEPVVRLASVNRDTSDAGAALALVLLLMLALSVLGVGALTLARRQAVVGLVAVRVLQASLAAESGLRAAGPGWPAAADSMPVGTSESWSGSVGTTGAYQIELVRLDRELYLARARGRSVVGRARHQGAALLWRLDPRTRVSGVPAAVVHTNGLVIAQAGQVDGSGDLASQGGAWCDPTVILEVDRTVAWPPVPPSSAWRADGALMPFDPVVDSVAGPGLGLIPFDSLHAVATPLAADLSPSAVECGESSQGPCPVDGIYTLAPGTHVLTGSVRGVLVVDGNVTLGGDALIEGWVLAAGDLRVSGSVRILGVVRSRGRVEVDGAARIQGDTCAAMTVLEHDWLRTPRMLPPGTGLGPPV